MDSYNDPLLEKELNTLLYLLKENIKQRARNISMNEPVINFLYNHECGNRIDFLKYQIYILSKYIENFPSFS